MEVCQRVGSFEKTVLGPRMPSFDAERDVWASWYRVLQNIFTHSLLCILPLYFIIKKWNYINTPIDFWLCNAWFLNDVHKQDVLIIITVNFLLLEKVIYFKNIKLHKPISKLFCDWYKDIKWALRMGSCWNLEFGHKKRCNLPSLELLKGIFVCLCWVKVHLQSILSLW